MPIVTQTLHCATLLLHDDDLLQTPDPLMGSRYHRPSSGHKTCD